jgi:hypothetical protein
MGHHRATIAKTSAPVEFGWMSACVRHTRGAIFSHCAAAAHEVKDYYDQSDYQQYVNQASANMKRETQKPQNQKNRDNGPKHDIPPGSCMSI